MRVLFVSRGYPTEKNPMFGNYEAVQARALTKRGIQVTVVVIRRIRNYFFSYQFVEKHFQDEGVDVYFINSTISYFIAPFYLFRDKRLEEKAICKFVRESLKNGICFDLVHAHIIVPAVFAIPLKTQFNLPLVVTEHWSRVNQDTVDSYIHENGKVYQYADYVMAVSHFLSTNITKNFGVKCHVVNNMVDDLFFEGNLEEHQDSTTVRFIAVGSLLPIKGFDMLIRAFAKMKKKSKADLCIIGNGSEYQNLQDLINSFLLQDKIHLLGYKSPEEISNLLSDSDCYVLSSKSETFCIACIEAMAKGLPVIATDCGGPKEYINEETGVFVPVDDEDALADAMDRMVLDGKKYNKDRIRNYCREHFSEDVIVEQLSRIYHETISKYK